jgi:hypothetical protein
MGTDDRLALTLLLSALGLFTTVGLLGWTMDLLLSGRRWTSRRLSMRAMHFLLLCAIGLAGFVAGVVLVSLRVISSATYTNVSLFFMPLGILGALSFAVVRKADRRPATGR